MRPLFLFLAVAAFSAAAPSRASSTPSGLSDALLARSMLNPGGWARIARFDNSHPRGAWRGWEYPRTVYALVFEFSGVLWLYTDCDGTQSLSRTLHTVARDEANPEPLFRAIEPGIGGWEWVEAPRSPPDSSSPVPPRACFIESIRAANLRMALGRETREPKLLLYYFDAPGGWVGHTVLLFRSGGSLSAIDSENSERPIRLPFYVGNNLRSIASYLGGRPVSAVRTFPVPVLKEASAERWASLPAKPAGNG